jgi:hypothetical protein
MRRFDSLDQGVQTRAVVLLHGVELDRHSLARHHAAYHGLGTDLAAGGVKAHVYGCSHGRGLRRLDKCAGATEFRDQRGGEFTIAAPKDVDLF